MTKRALAALLLASLFLTGCGKKATEIFTGKYLLAERPTEVDAPDAIEFRPDGSCVIDDGTDIGIVGQFRVSLSGRLIIEAGPGASKKFAYRYILRQRTLIVSADEKTALYYVRLHEGPYPSFDEITGIFLAHNDLGDSAGEITADHKFRDHLHSLSQDDHLCYDIHMDGTCSYTDGVVTYQLEHSDAPQQDIYIRDFIRKRDKEGLWIIDPFYDTLLCETPATNLDLPPIPKGYRDATAH